MYLVVVVLGLLRVSEGFLCWVGGLVVVGL